MAIPGPWNFCQTPFISFSGTGRRNQSSDFPSRPFLVSPEGRNYSWHCEPPKQERRAVPHSRRNADLGHIWWKCSLYEFWRKQKNKLVQDFSVLALITFWAGSFLAGLGVCVWLLCSGGCSELRAFLDTHQMPLVPPLPVVAKNETKNVPRLSQVSLLSNCHLL